MIESILEKTQYYIAVAKPTEQHLGLPNVSANQDFVTDILAIVLGVFGAVAVLVIIIGAINIAKSNGDPEAISKGKKTVIYALVGLAIAISAEMIVFFVLRRL